MSAPKFPVQMPCPRCTHPHDWHVGCTAPLHLAKHPGKYIECGCGVGTAKAKPHPIEGMHECDFRVWHRNDPTSLYRLFDDPGALLYVGITRRNTQRIANHSRSKPWWGFIAFATFQHFPCRLQAESAEKDAIKAEGPLFNIAGADVPWSFAAYCTLRMRGDMQAIKSLGDLA